MNQTADKPNYKKTLNLPQTAFPMKANLVQNEAGSLKRWGKLGLYAKLREQADAARAAGTPKPPYVFHDGPPYANGSIHLGHLLNKVLKDLVVRSQTMLGKDCPYTPGWDCHGLPIEHKVMQELTAQMGEAAKALEPIKVRRKCQSYAEKFVKLQKGQMQKLLTLADYDDPYLTMLPKYEAGALEVFAGLVAKGLVYRQLKPVHWSVENQTALAEAELEYYDREDTSVYVLFELQSPEREQGVSGGEKQHVMIWTTTPWTLPANLAVAVHPRFDYGLYALPDGKKAWMAVELAAKVFGKAGVETVPEPSETKRGEALVGLTYSHPFVERTGKVVAAEYVTAEDGTGLVHTAPGHGVDDWHTGLREGLDTYCPVKNDGTFDNTAPDWLVGQSIWDGNDLVIDKLRGSGHLFHAETFMHSYPHDWRGKTPVIFRATEQWFVGVDKPLKPTTPKPGIGDSTPPKPGIAEERSDEAVPGSDSNSRQDAKTPRRQEEKGLRAMALLCVGGPNLKIKANSKEEKDAQDSYIEYQDENQKLAEETLNEEPTAHTPEREDPKSTSESPFAGIETAEGIDFLPEWGRNRMRGMLDSRPDWCLSRQRSWGLPIPAFFPPPETPEETSDASPEPLCTEASVLAVSKVFGDKGSDAWFFMGSQDLLQHYDPSADPDAPAWVKDVDLATLQKGPDTFDVWFESGSSWHAVLQSGWRDKQSVTAAERDALVPADLYLEGADQHRGWFQHSLLPALAMTGQPAFKRVLTHGFMVTKDGTKMSKSLGNAVDVDELLKKHGADVARWWVASLNTDADIKVDWSYFDTAGDEYRKVRNTLRFLLGNLGDFDPSKDAHAFTDADAMSLEAWVLGEYAKVVAQARELFEGYRYRPLTRLLFNFCNDTLSSVYLAAVKDRLYCDKPDSTRRRRAQTAMFEIASGLIRLLGPVLPHTADEAWRALHQVDKHSEACVHLETLPTYDEIDTKFDPLFPLLPLLQDIFDLREEWLKDLELGRKSKGIQNPLDCKLTAYMEGSLKHYGPGEMDTLDLVDLADLLGISQFAFDMSGEGEFDLSAVDSLERTAKRCDRSWKRDGTVKLRSDGGMLSDRDAEALGLA